jgi:hypothetical protein
MEELVDEIRSLPGPITRDGSRQVTDSADDEVAAATAQVATPANLARVAQDSLKVRIG